ncbi:hypothetical protein Glove_9g256 [Diversispora epigaea]|uniref:Uncharacterized protein n=1 Tax=Diversispora epigaea TaxID=1348612 RepID=A0A397JYN2_9GLOM|nr:hypothetical protein Glove_9g256 [Diversispora epigaea]
MIDANEELSEKLESYLIEAKDSWLRTHSSFVYHSIFKFKELENFCNNIIAKYPNLIFESEEDFTSLQESALISILKNDDLQMEESIVIISYNIIMSICVSFQRYDYLIINLQNQSFPNLSYVCGRYHNSGHSRRWKDIVNNDTLYIAELACNNYENYEENELENDENNDIQEELLQNTRVRDANRG